MDPIGFDGGDTNLYRYTGNDPTNARDPSGLDYFELTRVPGPSSAKDQDEIDKDPPKFQYRRQPRVVFTYVKGPAFSSRDFWGIGSGEWGQPGEFAEGSAWVPKGTKALYGAGATDITVRGDQKSSGHCNNVVTDENSEIGKAATLLVTFEHFKRGTYEVTLEAAASARTSEDLAMGGATGKMFVFKDGNRNRTDEALLFEVHAGVSEKASERTDWKKEKVTFNVVVDKDHKTPVAAFVTTNVTATKRGWAQLMDKIEVLNITGPN